MDDIFVGALMSTTIETCRDTQTLRKVSQELVNKNISSLIVQNENGETVSLVTKTDIVMAVAEDKSTDEQVRKHIDSDYPRVKPDDPIELAASKMISKQVHHIPVVTEEDELIGILSTTDLAQYISPLLEPTPE